MAKGTQAEKIKSGEWEKGDSWSALQAAIAAPSRLSRPMKKIKCPHCAVVNLEKFVTYPHCAGCGALLTEETPKRSRAASWRRPLGTVLWASVVGAAAIGTVGAAMLFESRPDSMGQLLTYPAQVMRTVRAGQVFTMTLTVDAVEGSSRDKNTLRAVQLRFDRATLRDFDIVALDPMPGPAMRAGSGTYYNFGDLPRESQIAVTLRAHRAGNLKVRSIINAEQHIPTEFQARINVTSQLAESQNNKSRRNH